VALRISQVRLGINQPISNLSRQIGRRLNIDREDIKRIDIVKESIDARRKNKIDMVYTVDVELFVNEAEIILGIKDDKVHLVEHKEEEETLEVGSMTLEYPPVVVGTGPSGLFCSLLLARYGYKPLVVERGKNIEERSADVRKFWKTGILNPHSNVQFGEGGAGTFSDGKLTTRIKDKRCRWVLRNMVDAGAPGEIMYSSKPHIGTDKLKLMVENISASIKKFGGQVKVKRQVTDIIVKDTKLAGIVINGEEFLPCSVVVLAIGHSARDTFYMLYNKGVRMIAKAFSIGVRIEHLQHWVDKVQYGKFAGHPRLGAADYQLVYKDSEYNRTAYSFCMCPGGLVVAAASEENGLVTNGMSEYSRDRENANSALVVSVSPSDFPTDYPLAGIEFQRAWEQKAYQLGGGGFTAPVQRVEDFLKSAGSNFIGTIEPSYKPGVMPSDLSRCLPPYVTGSLKRALVYFNGKLEGFADHDVILTGVETRTSSPLRIVRTSTMESETIEGIYPAGEGAGYAGGIMSSAVDGLKVAEAIIKKFKPFS